MAYDPQIALKCADLSATVYLDQQSGPDEEFFSVNGTQVWLINESDAVYVVFRGTSYEDLMTDLKIKKEASDFGRVHRGFHAYVMHTAHLVEMQLHQWIPFMDKPIILTGHSLGAAATVIQACYLHRLGFDVSGVYTYGEPRVGDRQFAKYADEAFGDVHYRHVNGLDGVPMIPFIAWYYWHSGKRFYFSTHRQNLIRNAPLCQVVLERLPILLSKPWKWVANKKFDHDVFNYVAACHRNL